MVSLSSEGFVALKYNWVMPTNKYLAKIISEYKTSSHIYEPFCKAVEAILRSVLKENKFFFQDVTYRVKSFESLVKKVEGSTKKGIYFKKLSSIQDIGGCRVIFYLDSDIQRFANLLYKEFGKENIPIFKLKYSEDDYNASHLVIRLNKERLKLSEYSRFKYLICEIQLTTVLFHAWSEMAHNTIYKPPEGLASFDKEYFESLKKEFSDVMKNHIKQASHSFEFIYMNMEHLKRGKKIFSLDFLKSIIDLKSNNDIYESLKLLHNYIQKFGDKAPKELGLIKLIEAVLVKSRKIKTEDVKTSIGILKGIGYTQIAIICIDILEELNYLHTVEVFMLLVKLSSANEKEIREKALDTIGKLSQYRLQVLQKIYYFPQEIILSEIKKWSDEELIKNISVINASFRKLLSSSFEGHEMTDYKTFSWQFGSLKASEKLDKIRSTAIDFLKRVYSLTTDTTQKLEIITTLKEATHTPRLGQYGAEITDIVIKSTNQIIDFYISIVDKSRNIIIKKIDEQVHWFKERFKDNSLKNINKLNVLIEKNENYQIYRIFVGYEFRFRRVDNWQEAERIRSEKVKDYISEFSNKTYSKWKKIIIDIAKDNETGKDIGEFQNFYAFLHGIAKEQPRLILKLIKEEEQRLKPIIHQLFSGLWESNQREEFKIKVLDWVNKGEYLSSFAVMQIHFKPVDLHLLKKLLKKADMSSDTKTLINITQVIAYNFNDKKEMKHVFIDAIKALTKLENSEWAFYCQFKIEPLLKVLSATECEIVLNSLLYAKRVDYDIEEVLNILSVKYATKIIDFFHKRIQYKLKNRKDERYDAIPYNFHELNTKLSPFGNQLLPLILAWFKKKDWLFKWEASRLIHNIYPQFSSVLENILLKKIKEGKEANVPMILFILDSYDGEISTHRVCQEFIKKYNNKKYNKNLQIFLQKTGVVMGEYGLTDAYKKKLQEIQSWKTDKNPAIVSFVKEYEKSLKNQIVFETKMADEGIEMMKRTYGS